MVFPLLLSACVVPPHRPPPTPPATTVSYDNLAHDVQTRLLQEAHRAFGQERYRAAALLFRRFVEDAPNAPRVAEARWWLGRAYEQIGDYRIAMEEYRTLAAAIEKGPQEKRLYAGHALRRLDELSQTHAGLHTSRASQVALRLRIDQFPPLSTRSSWFEELVQAGVATVVVDLEPVATPDRSGIDMEMIRAGAAEAHRHGLLYWIGLDLHRGLSRAVRPEWTIRRCYGMAEDGGGRATVDVTNSSYQASVEETVRMLASAGIDGLVLAVRLADRFADECSAESLQGFARSFGITPTSEELRDTVVFPGDGIQERPVQYWHWAGWKARSYAQWVARLRKVLRAARPTATLLTEIHPSTLQAPLQGLEQFGEDVVELVTHAGGWIVVRDTEAVDRRALEQLDRQIGTKGRVWVERSVKVAEDRPVLTAVPELITGAGLDRWNAMIRVEFGERVP